MRIQLVTPAPTGSRQGNRVTAVRWARILRDLGHRVDVATEHRGETRDLLIALHARRSATSIRRFAHRRPEAPCIVVLTGTDLYQDLARSRAARESLELATRLVVLQPLAIEALPAAQRAKARVVVQSASRPARRPRPAKRTFDACVIGHLRPVKDPFLAARAVRDLPAGSRLRVLHAGAATTTALARRARAEDDANPRWCWLGELPAWRARATLARSRVLVHTSRLEGGANAICEALAAGVPVLTTAIPGSLGLLGRDWPAAFPVGDAGALRSLLLRCESDGPFLRGLARRTRALAATVAPAREKRALRDLLTELG